METNNEIKLVCCVGGRSNRESAEHFGGLWGVGANRKHNSAKEFSNISREGGGVETHVRESIS